LISFLVDLISLVDLIVDLISFVFIDLIVDLISFVFIDLIVDLISLVFIDLIVDLIVDLISLVLIDLIINLVINLISLNLGEVSGGKPLVGYYKPVEGVPSASGSAKAIERRGKHARSEVSFMFDGWSS
jgi:hypothetical protein